MKKNFQRIGLGRFECQKIFQILLRKKDDEEWFPIVSENKVIIQNAHFDTVGAQSLINKVLHMVIQA